MEARPFRQRGTESILQPLHQKHKSTGNLAMAAAAASASAVVGLRGPAKRAAFGDVTNTSKATINGQDGKLVKLQSISAMPNANLVNKENAPYSRGTKDSFSRPAYRPNAAFSSKHNLPTVSDANRKSANGFVPEFGAVPSAALAMKTYPSGASRPKTANTADRGAAVQTLVAPSNGTLLQPRHHKSQPQLKQQQQPMLRRTQSKQFDRANHASEKACRNSSAAGFEAITIGMPSRIPEEAIYAGLPYSVAEHEPLPHVNHANAYVELSTTLHHISGETQRLHDPPKDNLSLALSEVEEYWDEDDDEDEDDDYDDQDQAYTTAHSFRSQNFTTGGVTTILAPRINQKVQRELEEARIDVEQNRSLDDIEEEMWDVSMVAEYGEEIFEYLRELEMKMLPNPHYMETQTEIQWSMRAVLMDWLVQVHNRFSLLPETLFLTVNYIDRFLSYKIVSIGKLQLVGATAILVASKYEEINCPSLDEIVFMVDGGYTTEEILKAERFMLSMLSFELGWPGPMSFLRRVSKADDYDLDTRTLAKYFLELTIMDERFVASPPSFLAAGAHCLSRLVLNKGEWTKAHVHYSGYTWAQLRPLVTMMIECCERPRDHHTAVFEKYQEKRFKEASTVVQRALDAGFTLPHHNVPIRPLHAQMDDLSNPLQYANGLLVPAEG